MNLSDFSGRSRNRDLSKPLIKASKEELSKQPSPFIPPSLKSFKGMSYLPLYLQSLKESSLYDQSTGDQFKAAITLYMAAWESETACSIPNSIPSLERLLKMDSNEFMECLKEGSLKNGFMNGWILCSNNRFYHPYLARAMATTMNRFAEKQYQMEKARHKKEVQRAKLSSEDAAKSAPVLKLLCYEPNVDELPIFKVHCPVLANGRVQNPEDYNFVDGWDKLLSRNPYNENTMREIGYSVFDSSEEDESVAWDGDTDICPQPVPGTNSFVAETKSEDPENRLNVLDQMAGCPLEIATKVKDKEKGKDKEKEKEKKYQQGGCLSERFDLSDDLVVDSLIAKNNFDLRNADRIKALGEVVLPEKAGKALFRNLELRSFWADLASLGFSDPVKNRIEFPESLLQDLVDLGVQKPVFDRAYEIMVQSYGRNSGQTVALYKKILVNFVATIGAVSREINYFSEDLAATILRLPPQTIQELDKIIRRDRREASELIRMYCDEEESLKKAIWAVSNIEKGRASVEGEIPSTTKFNPLIHFGDMDK